MLRMPDLENLMKLRSDGTTCGGQTAHVAKAATKRMYRKTQTVSLQWMEEEKK